MVDSKLNIPVSIKGSQPQIQRLKKQDEDDHWISEEELYTEGSSDEEKPSHSSRKHNLKGMNREEIAKRDEDLLQMRNTLRQLEDKLRSGKFVEEIYDVGRVRSELKKELGGGGEDNEKIAAQMLEVKEFDRMLRVKVEEMKMAKLERIREAEESSQLLKELSKSKTSDAVKLNCDQFLKLLQNEVSEYSGETTDANRAAIKAAVREKVKFEDPARRPGTFIERNIQLAKCGDGILSLTDEEKIRLKLVLKDVDDAQINPDDLNLHDDYLYIPKENQFVLYNDVRRVLAEIDRKLEEHEKTKIVLPSVRTSESKLDTHKENNKSEDPGKEKVKPRVQNKSDGELRRLREVDKLLNTLNSTTQEVIDPLLEEDMQYLIEESKQVLLSDSAEEIDPLGKLPSKEKMVELVSAAKSSMPNFQFRHLY